MRWICAVAASLFVTGVAISSASAQPTTAACRQAAGKAIDYQACADQAQSGSNEQRWAQINLGTQALMARDYPKAAGLYDAASAGGMTIYSDASFHAFRAEAYSQVGRKEEALADAKLALAILTDGEGVPPSAFADARAHKVEETVVYAIIIPILHEAKSPRAPLAIQTYLALPTDGHVSKMANRAIVLSEVGEHGEAISESERVVAKEPHNSSLLNNHCDILRMGGRAADALSFCDRSLKIDPKSASTYHTRAGVLAALGRCDESRQALDEARRLAASGRVLPPVEACTPRAG